MGGEDKGLISLQGKPLIDTVIAAIEPQVGNLLISANRNQALYRTRGLPVVADMPGEYLGPLAGMAAGMRATDKPYIVTVPCDSPFIPETLVATLYHTLHDNQADISVAHDGSRMQPVFALLRCELLPSLLTYLDEGGRRIDSWYNQQHLALVDFPDSPDTFINLNTPEDLSLLESRMTG